MMTEAEKIEWFNKIMDWLSQWPDYQAMVDAVDTSSDAPYDLVYDAVEQRKKDCGNL